MPLPTDLAHLYINSTHFATATPDSNRENPHSFPISISFEQSTLIHLWHHHPHLQSPTRTDFQYLPTARDAVIPYLKSSSGSRHRPKLIRGNRTRWNSSLVHLLAEGRIRENPNEIATGPICLRIWMFSCTANWSNERRLKPSPSSPEYLPLFRDVQFGLTGVNAEIQRDAV
jgi:hypothetical protein